MRNEGREPPRGIPALIPHSSFRLRKGTLYFPTSFLAASTSFSTVIPSSSYTFA